MRRVPSASDLTEADVGSRVGGMTEVQNRVEAAAWPLKRLNRFNTSCLCATGGGGCV
jgi:hypothetical protein